MNNKAISYMFLTSREESCSHILTTRSYSTGTLSKFSLWVLKKLLEQRWTAFLPRSSCSSDSLLFNQMEFPDDSKCRLGTDNWVVNLFRARLYSRPSAWLFFLTHGKLWNAYKAFYENISYPSFLTAKCCFFSSELPQGVIKTVLYQFLFTSDFISKQEQRLLGTTALQNLLFTDIEHLYVAQ